MSIFPRRAQRAEMAISERELAQLTRELDELHESTFPQVREALGEWSANLGSVVRQPSTRRSFFLGAAGAVALGAAAACSGGSPGTVTTSSTPAAPPAPAETYTFAIANVTDSGGIKTAATIQPVETMHAAILNFVLGQYPIPDTFIGTTNALKPNTLTVK